jgi:hypothetical protein
MLLNQTIFDRDLLRTEVEVRSKIFLIDWSFFLIYLAIERSLWNFITDCPSTWTTTDEQNTWLWISITRMLKEIWNEI